MWLIKYNMLFDNKQFMDLDIYFLLKKII